MKFHTVLVLAALGITGCAHNDTTVLTPRKATGPKVVALSAPQAAWVVPIVLHLRKAGFQVLRVSSVQHVTEHVSTARTEDYAEATSRYVLALEGYAAVDSMHRCFGGGYDFDHLSADLVDTKTNETLVNVTASGYSEGCPPASGKIFTSIAKAVSSAWD